MRKVLGAVALGLVSLFGGMAALLGSLAERRPVSVGTLPAVAHPSLPMGPVALLFMVKDELVLHGIWEAWVEEAKAWAQRRYPAAFAYHGLSAVLTIYAHGSSKRELLLPEWMKNTTVPRVKCRWGATVPCMVQVTRAAFQGRPSEPAASFFIYVSGNTIPVKPLSVIHDSLLENPRSRFSFSNVNMKTPKHHQWVVLSRAHVAVLMENNAAEWRGMAGKWRGHRYPDSFEVSAADDEYTTFAALAKRLGRRQAEAGINDGNPMPPFEDTRLRPYQEKEWQTTWVCWGEDDCLSVGEILPLATPALFLAVDGNNFAERVRRPNFWFARKFSSTTKLGCTSAAEGIGRNFTLFVRHLLPLFFCSPEQTGLSQKACWPDAHGPAFPRRPAGLAPMGRRPWASLSQKACLADACGQSQ